EQQDLQLETPRPLACHHEASVLQQASYDDEGGGWEHREGARQEQESQWWIPKESREHQTPEQTEQEK
ncbi:hypothetical protein GLOTRDRAFT_134675, partial [Gloeophyllum trabeum ATCC 11539]